MKKHWITIFFALICSGVCAQNKTVKKYWIEFSNKKNTPYTVNAPQGFLSPRAIERRKKQGIPIVESDLPLDPLYLEKVHQTGARVQHVSKWLNAATIIADSNSVAAIELLDFVKKIEFVGRHFTKSTQQSGPSGQSLKNYIKPNPYHRYGYGRHQIQMVNGDILHDIGYRGKGVLVAVMDGGFINVNHMPFFDSLRTTQRLLQGKDLVDMDDEIFESATHGSEVLSVMASNLPGLFIGTAPDAHYICIKTEDTRGEYLAEECHWVAGLEYADSLGVDVVNSSLGYTSFWDKSMNYAYEDMNGQVSRAARAADVAHSKGMIVVNSAGNSGGDAWKYIGAPADANNILTVGATDYYGNRAYFSSFGPTADGRLKPNVSAMGNGIIVAKVNEYKVKLGNGTSFSSPLIAGMVASLWSAFPEKTNDEIIEAIELCGSQADRVDNKLGYGIPDFYKAYQLLNGSHETTLSIYPNPQIAISQTSSNELEIVFLGKETELSKLYVYDLLGKLVHEDEIEINANVYNRHALQLKSKWKAGFYVIQIKNGTHTFLQKTMLKR